MSLKKTDQTEYTVDVCEKSPDQRNCSVESITTAFTGPKSALL